MTHRTDTTPTTARIKRIVENSDTRAGRIFDVGVLTLIVVSLVSFSVETLPNLPSVARSFLRYIELITVTCFTIEYLLRVAVADRKPAFIFSFFGVIDLVAILPFYLSLGFDLRSVRAIRLLRLFRLLKLGRYNTALRRLRHAAIIVKEELVLFLCVALILIYLSAVGVYFFENAAQPEEFASVFHGLWWAVVTLTTVGYGDVYPVTVGGRLFTFIVLMLGLGIVAVPTGLFASALSKAREEERRVAPAPDSDSTG